MFYIPFYVLSITIFLGRVGAFFQTPSQRWLTNIWKSDQKHHRNQTSHLTIHPVHPSARKLTSGGDTVTGREVKPVDLPSLLMESITLQLSAEDDATAITFNGVHVEEDSWYGTDQGGGVGSIHLVRPKGSRHLEGVAITPKGEIYTISTQPKDGSVFVYHSSNSDTPIMQLYLGIHHENIQEHTSNRHRMLGASPADKDGIIEVDIMVLYTKRAMCAHAYLDYPCETKGPEGRRNREAIEAEAMLNYLITNVALQQSNSKVRFNLVHVGLDKFNYDSNGISYEKDGDQLSTVLDTLLIEENDDVHKLRNHTGADVVALIVDRNYDDYETGEDNAISGDVFYTSGNDCRPGEKSDDGFDASTDTCPGRAYIVVSRNGRHHFLFPHELFHLFYGNYHNNVCNEQSNTFPYYAPCFQTISTQRGVCSDCLDSGGKTIVSGSGTSLIPRIPLFTGPNGVEYSGFPLNQVGNCDRAPTFLTDAECFDFNGPLVASFRKRKTGSRHEIKITFAFAFVTACAIIGLVVKKRRQVLVERDVAAEVYVAERQFDMVSMDKKANLARMLGMSNTASTSPFAVRLVGDPHV
jgi:hypothetical protein